MGGAVLLSQCKIRRRTIFRVVLSELQVRFYNISKVLCCTLFCTGDKNCQLTCRPTLILFIFFTYYQYGFYMPCTRYEQPRNNKQPVRGHHNSTLSLFLRVEVRGHHSLTLSLFLRVEVRGHHSSTLSLFLRVEFKGFSRLY